MSSFNRVKMANAIESKYSFLVTVTIHIFYEEKVATDTFAVGNNVL